MKKLRYILFASAALVLGGCGAWLDEPRPMGQSEEQDMFKTEQGFRSVLVGTYIGMAEDKLYGRNMSLMYPEVFAQNWQANVESTEYSALEFDFTRDTRLNDVLTESWTHYHLQIANLNSLLAAIDGKRDLFNEADFNLVKGEALGLRGFLHFEMLRLWGPVPEGADPAKVAIPYVTEVTDQISPLQSKPYGEVMELIIKDLDQAEELLVDDPITRFTHDLLNTPSSGNTAIIGDDFYYRRQTRFNLYAVKAAKARYYMWAGNYEKARESAVEVIEGAVGEGGESVFTLCDGAYFTDNPDELTLIPEHIFSVFRNNLGDVVRPIYKMNGIIWQSEANMNAAFESSSNPNDIRYFANRYWQMESSGSNNYWTFKKYITEETQATDEVVAKWVPLIRLSEMYLIATECSAVGAFNAADVEEYFEPYRIARNINVDTASELIDQTTVLARLEKEYRKDFFGEGQMFYYYKRQGTTTYTWPANISFDVSRYVIPKPERQITFE